ncbi:nucleoside monophosphate kinase [Candidatus Saccharibacteria bacterium]|nr:nucleoside monophosphate kinase [Candidatus Saccharibacteria bacterium]
MIILFGLAGSGKGTQGNALAELFGWRTLSVGQAIRDTGDYQEIINRGDLIPDEDVIKLMDKQIAKTEAEGYDVILDGYPRTVAQAKYIAEHLASQVKGAIILDVPKEELYQRLALRAEFESRDDDKERASIDRRFEVFEQNISSILPLLEAKNIPIAHVDGVGEIDEVTARLVATVKKMDKDATIQEQDVNNMGEIEHSYGE